MSKQIETLVICYNTYKEYIEEGTPLPRYYIINALGDYVFIRTRDRTKAQQYIDEEYKGMYKLRTHTLEKGGGTGCVATATRKGQHVANTSYGIPRSLR